MRTVGENRLHTDSRVLDIIAAAIQTSAIDDPSLDNGELRPAVQLNNEDSWHLARTAVKAIEDAGFVIVLREKERLA